MAAMPRELKKMGVVFVLTLLLNAMCTEESDPAVPCYFVFGDSLVDSGNNNQLSSLARANFPPYGIDFPSGPTGRFSNGKTTVDFIVELLGLDGYIPSYSTAARPDLLRGVNYASGAAGIRPETGQQLGERINFTGQVQNYVKTFQQMLNLLGSLKPAADYLDDCIYSIGLGSNDYLNNYFMPQIYPTGHQYTPEEFADALIQQYTDQLKILYQFGARKMALFGVGLIGCSPSVLAQNSPGDSSCNQRINGANEIFNEKLKSLATDLRQTLEDVSVTFINTSGIFQDIINNASSYGFKNTNTGCCGLGKNRGQITCLPLQSPCRKRSEHVFWDAFHPTEAVNRIIASRAFQPESPTDVFPMGINDLAHV